MNLSLRKVTIGKMSSAPFTGFYVFPPIRFHVHECNLRVALFRVTEWKADGSMVDRAVRRRTIRFSHLK